MPSEIYSLSLYHYNIQSVQYSTFKNHFKNIWKTWQIHGKSILNVS